jgi:hypothetical protein
MASSNKKAIVRLEDGGVHAGYLPGAGVVARAGARAIELLSPAGKLLTIGLDAVRYVAYVRDFNLDDTTHPERLLRKTFQARPRTEGLWLRVTMRDGDTIEGIAGLDISLLDDAMADEGVFLIPPDIRSNTQRLYIPRSSMRALAILGVVTSPSKAAAKAEREDALLPFPDR